MEFIDYHLTCGYLIVQGNCKICKERIEKAALSIKGVNGAIWNICDSRLSLSFDPRLTNLNEISMVIAQTGHTTNLHKANKESLDKMQSCCKSIMK